MGCRIQGKDHALKRVKLSLWQFKGCTEIPVVGSNASICCLEAVGVTRRKRVEGKEARTGRVNKHTTTTWLAAAVVWATNCCYQMHQDESNGSGGILQWSTFAVLFTMF